MKGDQARLTPERQAALRSEHDAPTEPITIAGVRMELTPV